MCQGCLVSRWVGSDLQGPGCPDFMALSTALMYLKLSCWVPGSFCTALTL